MSYFSDDCRPSMLGRRRTSPTDPVSIAPEDYSMRKQTVSVIFSVLPFIQSRLPPMLSMATTPTSRGWEGKRWTSSTSSGTTTPFTEADTLVGDEERPVGTLRFAAGYTTPGSGVDWKCGRPGLELLVSALDKGKNAAMMRSGQVSSHDATFERRAYLDGVSYMLRGLPQDLDKTEMSVLQEALPSSLARARMYNRGQLILPGQSGSGHTKPSVLHKSMRAIVARAIVWFCILWPYILVLLRWAAAYDKKHSISEQVVSQCMSLVTACGRFAVGVCEVICSRADGRVGQALADTVAWTVHDMVAGVSEGVQDGLSQAGRGQGS